MIRRLRHWLPFTLGVLLVPPWSVASADLPNILWIVTEDINPHLGADRPKPRRP
jgi:hypothetical protein